MTVVLQSGVSAQSVGTSSEADLLVDGVGTPANGAVIANAHSWSLMVSTDQDVTVRVYLKIGPNAGLQVVSGWTAVAGSSTPYSLLFDGLQGADRIRVTAQAVTTAATVNCDFVAVSP